MAKGKKSKGTKYVSKGEVPAYSKKHKKIINKDKPFSLTSLRIREKMIDNIISLKNPTQEQKRLKTKYLADKECDRAITPYLNKYRYLSLTLAEAKQAYLTNSLAKLDNKYKELANKLKQEEKKAVKNDRRSFYSKAS